MEIKNENLIAAYNAADESGKTMLRAMFPDMEWNETKNDNRPVTERIKTFEDAVEALGEDHTYVRMFKDIYDKSEVAGANANRDVVAYLKLRIITAALNEGWEPQFTEEEWRYYPWYNLCSSDELAEKSKKCNRDICRNLTGEYKTQYSALACANSNDVPSNLTANVGYRLYFKSGMLANYAGKQFIDLWMDFYLIRK